MHIISFLLAFAAIFGTTACGEPEPEPQPEERYISDEGIRSTILKREIRYSILLPEGYSKDKNKRYPVVYMLHGYGDDNNSWNGKWLHGVDRITYLEKEGLSDMIYVFPQGFNTYYCNFDGGGFNYMDMFVQELIPFIDQTYRTIPDRQHRSITGYSMGGFGAMVLAEKHPEMFLCSAPLSMSFRTDAQYMAESQSGWDNQWGNIFGGKGQMGTNRLTDYYKEHCPYYQFVEANRAALSNVKWYFTCGDDEEQLLIANDSLHVLLRDRGFDHEFRVGDGAHTSSYWMGALNEVLPMFDFYMNGGQKWTGIDMDAITTAKMTLESDGTYQSPKFKTDGTGKSVFLFHDNLSAEVLNDIIFMIQASKGGAFVIIPCNIADKSIESKIASFESKYPGTTKYAFCIGAGGEFAMKSTQLYENYYLVNSNAGDVVGKLAKESRYYFACTDECEYYKDMANLYKSCKLGGYTFEYRVLNASEDAKNDILRLIKSLNSKITLY